jgi:hypothetical protein
MLSSTLMVAFKATVCCKQRIVALQNRGDGALVRSCDFVWRNGLGHDVERGGQCGGANLLIVTGAAAPEMTASVFTGAPIAPGFLAG